ncbi:MAG: hypothetical protein M3Q14_03010 [bacterium]|nr:hypothetical protein [bacterium]
MRRRNNVPLARDGSYLRANQENRRGRILKVWRRVEEDDASLMSGALSELFHSEDIPEVKRTSKMDAFIFDPRLMPRNFNSGFISGYQFGRVLDRISNAECINDDGYTVAMGGIGLLANRRTILMRLDSERLTQERQEIYAILGRSGVKGFTEDGHRRQRRSIGTPTLVLGNFVQQISKADEGMIKEVIETSVEGSLVSANGNPDINLGPLDIKAYNPSS